MTRMIDPDLQNAPAKKERPKSTVQCSKPSGNQILGSYLFIGSNQCSRRDHLAATPIGHWDLGIGALN